jgi:hypothetical protein
MFATSRADRCPRRRLPLGLAGALLLAACASAPPAPLSNLQAAQQAIAVAERGEAARYAPGELSESHTRLAMANTAVSERKMMVAEHLADESRAEAELASAKTSAAKAHAVNDEMKRSNGTLVDEMKRSSGDRP